MEAISPWYVVMIRWNSALSLTLLAATMFATAARAGEHTDEWSRRAGGHLGTAEAAAKCLGMKLNAKRRDEIIGLSSIRGSGSGRRSVGALAFPLLLRPVEPRRAGPALEMSSGREARECGTGA